MTYQTIKFPGLFGGAYQSRSRSFSSQKCINLYPEMAKSGKTSASLNSFPGLKGFSTSTPGSADRGAHVMGGLLYKVGGGKLYSISANGTVSELGSGIAGTDRCIFADNGTTLIICANGSSYAYTVDGGLSIVSDPDLVNAGSVAYLNNQFIYGSIGSTFCTSDVGDGTSIDSLNYASAESGPDDILRVYVYKQVLYLFGEQTIEPWFNSGEGSPPFDRVENGIIQVGIASRFAITQTDNYVYFIGDDFTIYRLSGYQAEPITPPGIARVLESSELSDSYAGVIKTEGQNIIKFTIPSNGKTICYSEQTSEWFELASTVNNTLHRAGTVIRAYNKNLAVDPQTGDIIEFDLDTYSDLGVNNVKQRDTMTISGELINMPGGRFLMSRFELIMETGIGLNNETIDNPHVIFQYSIDGGKSFSNEDWVLAGELGQTVKVEWYKMISFTELIIRIKVVDPVFVSIHSAAIDVQEDGY